MKTEPVYPQEEITETVKKEKRMRKAMRIIKDRLSSHFQASSLNCLLQTFNCGGLSHLKADKHQEHFLGCPD